MKADYKVEDFQPLNGGGIVKAVFDVTLASGLRINGCRLLVTVNGTRWVAFPAKKITDAAGKMEWFAHCDIRDRGEMKAFQKGVLAEIDRLNGKEGPR